MANVLKVAMRNVSAMLLGRGRSQREVARELGVSRNTVARYAALACSGEPEGAILTAGSDGCRSDCEPLRETTEAKLALGLSAQRVWQDLREESECAPGFRSGG